MMDSKTATLYRAGRYISAFKDRHGKVRYRFRKKGLSFRYFTAPKDSDHFKSEYVAFMAGQDHPAYQKPRQNRIWTPSRKKPHRVYFISSRGTAPVKIGLSRDPKKRLASMQVSNPNRLHIMTTVVGDESLERAYHERFAHLRLNGEWFARSPELMQEIRELKRRPLSNLDLHLRHQGEAKP